MESNPTATTSQIAKACKVGTQYVYQVRADAKKRITKSIEEHMDNIHAMRLGRPKLRMQASFDREPPTITMEDPRVPQFDNVNHPAHYRAGGIETIDFIEAKDLNYRLGNAVKYITRAKHKGNQLEDLKKAQWYLNREIDKLTGENK
jgi:hypothetical protein